MLVFYTAPCGPLEIILREIEKRTVSMTWGAGAGSFTAYNIDLEIPGQPVQQVDTSVVQVNDPRLATFSGLNPGRLYQASVTTLGSSPVVGPDRRFRTSKILQDMICILRPPPQRKKDCLIVHSRPILPIVPTEEGVCLSACLFF